MAGWPHELESLRFCREISVLAIFSCLITSSGVATRASSKHEGEVGELETVKQTETHSRVYITVENSPNSPSI